MAVEATAMAVGVALEEERQETVVVPMGEGVAAAMASQAMVAVRGRENAAAVAGGSSRWQGHTSSTLTSHTVLSRIDRRWQSAGQRKHTHLLVDAALQCIASAGAGRVQGQRSPCICCTNWSRRVEVGEPNPRLRLLLLAEPLRSPWVAGADRCAVVEEGSVAGSYPEASMQAATHCPCLLAQEMGSVSVRHLLHFPPMAACT